MFMKNGLYTIKYKKTKQLKVFKHTANVCTERNENVSELGHYMRTVESTMKPERCIRP